MLPPCGVAKAPTESASRLKPEPAKRAGVKQRRHFGETAAVASSSATLSPLRDSASPGARALEYGAINSSEARKDNVDPAVLAVFKAKNFLAADQAVLDDPVDRAANQLVRARFGRMRVTAAHLAAVGARGDAFFQRLDRPASERDLGHMK